MKQLFSILTFSVMVACNVPDKSTKLKSDTVLENKFEQLTRKVLVDSSEITFRLDTLTGFSWDTVIILKPYFPIEELEGQIKIDLSEIKNTKITSDEVSNVLAFIKHGRLINYADLPRTKGDFSQITDTNMIFTKERCIFELVLTENKFSSGERIVIARPIE